MKLTNEGNICTLTLERFDKQRLPIIINLKVKVDNGNVLDDLEIMFLEHVYKDASELLPQCQQQPEFSRIFSQAICLYNEINQQVIENTKR